MERERILAILYDRLEKAVEKRKIASWKLTNALSAPHRQGDGALIQVASREYSKALPEVIAANASQE